jgi:S-adenosylmethionine:tRNA ribosyltransferase-isomerase
MHSEPFSVSRRFIEMLRSKGDRPLTAVGTTSTRCLESLYFIGVHCIEKGEPGLVEQWEPYRETGYSYTLTESMTALRDYMDRHALDSLTSRTRIIIVPGYRFRVIDYLVTNFHQPQSTLLLLIGAFVGESWRDIYAYALAHDFRFLSYGDSSLLQKVS